MLRIIAEWCTSVLVDHGTIQESQKRIYIYGFELFWSTSLCVISILIISCLGGQTGAAVTFLLFFMPIRMAAGGYHASAYETCFLLTNLIAFLCIEGAWISQYVGMIRIEAVFWIVFVCAYVYIWKAAPINVSKYPLPLERIQKNRKCSHWILLAEAVGILVLRLCAERYVVYTAILTTCAVALMILIVRKEGNV